MVNNYFIDNEKNNLNIIDYLILIVIGCNNDNNNNNDDHDDHDLIIFFLDAIIPAKVHNDLFMVFYGYSFLIGNVLGPKGKNKLGKIHLKHTPTQPTNGNYLTDNFYLFIISRLISNCID